MFLCACKCVHVCVRGIVFELCTCITYGIIAVYSKPYTLHVALSALIGVNWARIISGWVWGRD